MRDLRWETIAKQIEIDNSGRVSCGIDPSLHSPGGVQDLQITDEFPYDLQNAQGIYGATFASGFGFDANPKGTISRKYRNHVSRQTIDKCDHKR
jgi:hypothetical protein